MSTGDAAAREQSLREAIANVSRLLWERGWVANHDGNITVRLDDGRLLATPTAVSKRLIGPDDLLLLSPEGKLAEAQRAAGKPFSELHLHLRCYRARPDVMAVVHAHPPTATGFAVAGLGITTALIAEAIVSLGPGAPLVPYGRPGSTELEENLAAVLVEADADAALLANHGAITVGSDLEQAYLRMELVEHLARIQLAARQIGRTNPLPEAETAFLLERRTAAGLGAAARSGRPSSPPSSSPSPTAAPAAPRAARPTTDPPQCGEGPGSIPRGVLDAATIERAVREELARLLGR